MNVNDRVKVVEEAAQALFAPRMEIIRDLARADTEVEDLETELAAKKQARTKLYATAERRGWAPDELRRLGIKAPSTRPRGRPRKHSHSTTSGQRDRPEPATRADGLSANERDGTHLDDSTAGTAAVSTFTGHQH
jgi:hypothetical protein